MDTHVTSLLADTLIPDDSKSPWDYRGSKSLTNEAYEALFECKTYEELIPKLEIAIEALEAGADCSAPYYVASGCRLARIRAYYIIGETEKADKLLERYSAVYRKADGTPDFGEEVPVKEKAK